MSNVYALSEVEMHNGRNGQPCWIIIKGSVYDVTKFLNDHPGGKEILLEYGGKNATKEFNSIGHSSEAIEEMEKFKIGVLSEAVKTCENGQTHVTDTNYRTFRNWFFCC